jgi:hypothetical protein
MDPERQEVLVACFPALRDHPSTVASPATEDYNCFTHAVGRTDVWAWPEGRSHWLAGVLREATIQSLVGGLSLLGYEPCEGGDLEPGVEKVCIYARGDEPLHVARQLPSGDWMSKLGREVDITHTLAGLEGDCYGKPVAFLKRSSTPPTPFPSPGWLPPTTT